MLQHVALISFQNCNICVSEKSIPDYQSLKTQVKLKVPASMPLSSVVTDARASVMKCEATMKALETAFSQARSELAEVRSALDSLATYTSSQVGNLENLVEEPNITAMNDITNGESPGPGLEYDNYVHVQDCLPCRPVGSTECPPGIWHS